MLSIFERLSLLDSLANLITLNGLFLPVGGLKIGASDLPSGAPLLLLLDPPRDANASSPLGLLGGQQHLFKK